MKSPNSQQHLPDRLPGRSFTDPSHPLGDGLIDRAEPGTGVAERAKAVSVLRKAEELMASGNPDGGSEDGRRRAIELACGRCGVHLDEFDRIVDHDAEVKALMTNVMEAAREHAVRM
jgi:hypothetical protein